MSRLAIRQRSEQQADGWAPDRGANQRARPVRVVRGLPSGRAVVGGLLIAVAAVGTFAAYSGATADHQVDYVVARGPLTVGEQLTMGDLTLAPMNLPRQLASRWAFRSPASLVGAVVVGPLETGELIQASDVVAGPSAPGQEEMSFSISDADAVGGALEPGDRVDVLATFGTGTQARTDAVLADAPVIAQTAGSSSLGPSGTGSETVTLGLSSPAQALSLTQAVNSGAVMLVRVTGAAGVGLPASGSAAGSTTTRGTGPGRT